MRSRFRIEMALIAMGMALLVFGVWPRDDGAGEMLAAQEAARRELVTTTRPTTTTSTPATVGAALVEPAPPTPPDYSEVDQGTPIGTIRIPAIDVDWVFYLGVTASTLNKGPGLTPWFAAPGEEGAAVIAGHRTTYGAPFNRVDELVPGDLIELEVEGAVFTYAVTGQEIIRPEDWMSLLTASQESDERVLVLSACHPKGSLRERILVHAELVAVSPVPGADLPARGATSHVIRLPEARVRDPIPGLTGRQSPDPRWPVPLRGTGT
ncbi:MAG: class E sortase [Actinomycetes bacterium]|jgi:sortase A